MRQGYAEFREKDEARRAANRRALDSIEITPAADYDPTLERREIVFDVVARETGPILQSVCNDVLDALQAFALQPPDLEIDGVLARKYALEYLRSLSNDPLVYLAALAMRAEVERRRIA